MDKLDIEVGYLLGHVFCCNAQLNPLNRQISLHILNRSCRWNLNFWHFHHNHWNQNLKTVCLLFIVSCSTRNSFYNIWKCFTYLFDARIAKTCKKMKSHDGFLSQILPTFCVFAQFWSALKKPPCNLLHVFLSYLITNSY